MEANDHAPVNDTNTTRGTKPETKCFTETGYVEDKLPKFSTGSKMEKYIMYFRRVVSSRIKLL
jgi:hypothetical protein